MLVQNHIKSYGHLRLLTTPHFNLPSTRKVIDLIQAKKGESANSNVKKALLAAKKKERIKLPNNESSCASKKWHISEFFNHPIGIEAMLNVNALEYYIPLDANTYRCKLPPVQLLNFEVAPVLVLQVNPTSEACTVELLSCKIYNRPFNLLPVSAIEGPGTLVVQALLDRFVPLLSQQLLRDYDIWVKEQSRTLP